MNNEETIFPRRDIYVDHVQNAHNLHIHRMSISCFVLWKILAILQVGTLLNAFNINGFLPIDVAKIGIFQQPMLKY